MFPPTPPKNNNPHVQEHTLVADETLHMLNVVLKTAFRRHCPGETVCGKGPWQLVRDVQQKLLALSHRPARVVSEERLAHYVAQELSDPDRNPVPRLKLVGAT